MWCSGALLGPLRRRVAAVLASDKFAASLIDRLRVEEARESAALAAVAPEAALTEARSDDALRADLARAAADAAEPGTYLEKVHVYALALALRRPLVVYADPREHGSIAGVYLPDLYALLPAAQPTSRVPLALAYTGVGASGHFSSCCGAEGAPRGLWRALRRALLRALPKGLPRALSMACGGRCRGHVLSVLPKVCPSPCRGRC